MESQRLKKPLRELTPASVDNRTIRRKILIVSPSQKQGEISGPDVSFLAARLAREGQTVSLLSCSPQVGGLTGRLSWLRELHHRVNENEAVFLQANPPLEIATSLLPAFLLGRFFGKQIVVSFAGGNVEDLFGKFSRTVLPLLRLATRIVVPTEWSARLLAKYHLPVSVVPPAIDAGARTARLVQEVQPRILSFVLAGPDSNVTTILRAFRLAKQKYPRLELALVAPASRIPALQGIVGQENSVELLVNSEVAAVNQCWEKCDLLVNNSTDDDLPTPVLTALASGIPVISADSGGMTAVVQNRQSGLIFPANDPASLASRIIELIEDPALVTLLSRSGPLEAHRFGWSAVRTGWISLFNR